MLFGRDGENDGWHLMGAYGSKAKAKKAHSSSDIMNDEDYSGMSRRIKKVKW